MNTLDTDPETRINQSRNPEERRVNLLFHKLGFTLIKPNVIVRRDDEIIGEIDGFFKHEKTMIIIETKKTKKKTSSGLKIEFYSKWSAEENLKLLREQFNIPSRIRFIRIFVDLHNEAPARETTLVAHLSKDNHIIYKNEFEEIEENFQIVGTWEINNLLRKFQIKRKPYQSMEIDAIYCTISDNSVFLFSLPASQLLDCSTITRRHVNDTGYQRSIRASRITSIRTRIIDGSITAFPNTIIVNSEKKLLIPNSLSADELLPTHVRIQIPLDYSFLKVIDGQHRLLAFTQLDENIQEQHHLAVTAFEKLDSETETNLFVDINTEQVRVDPSLVLILKSDNADSPSHKYWYDKKRVEVAQSLDKNSELKGGIFMGFAGTKRKDKLVPLETLATAMRMNRFVGPKSLFQTSLSDTKTPATVIRKIFASLRLGGLISDSEKFFLLPKGIRIIFRFVQMCERNRIHGNTPLGYEEIITKLSPLVTSNFINQIESYSGLAGAKQAVEEMFDLLINTYPNEFGAFILDLKKIR